MKPRYRSAALFLAGALALALSTSATSADAMPSPFLKGPYLQDLGSSGVTVRVEVEPAAPVSVDIVHDGEPTRTVVDAASAAFHAVRIDKLKPQTRYEYVVHAAGADAKGELVTAPADDSGAPFTFLVYGDNRTDESAHAAVVRAMQSVPSDFLLHTGDFVESGGDTGDWQSFFRVETPLLRSRCVFACVGNHELFEDRAATNYARYFAPSDSNGRLYSTFRWSSARFFLLNAFHDWTGGDERAWLDGELAKADDERGLRWRIAVVHQGLWSAGPHGRSPTLTAAAIPDLFAKHHIDLVVSGHDHIYERGEAGGIRYIVSGGGGAPLYKDIHALPSTRKVEPAYHFVEVNVAADQVKLATRRADGSILERCGFGKSPGWSCDSVAAATLPSPSSASPAASAPATSDALPSPPAASRCGCDVVGRRAIGPAAFAPLLAALAILRARRKKG